MLNIIRADLYRIFSGKAIYIILGLLILFIVLHVSGNVVGVAENFPNGNSTSASSLNDAANTAEVNEIVDRLQGDMAANAKSKATATGMTAPFEIMKATGNLIYFLLPIIILIGAFDFSSGTVKNILSHGTSRTQYYIAKLMLAFLFSILILLLNLIIPIIIATVINGFGGNFTKEWLISVLSIFCAQTVVMLAVASVGILILFLTKRTAAFTWLYVAFFLLPTIIILSLAQYSPDIQNLLYYDLPTNFGILSGVSKLPMGDILRSITTSAAYVAIGIVAGTFSLKKYDVK